MLKLKLQYFGHLMWRTDSSEKTLMVGKIEGRRRKKKKKKKAGGEGDDREWDGWMASVTQWIRVLINYGSWQWAGMLGMLQSMGSQRVGQDWVIELNWTELIGVLWYFIIVFTNDKWYTESYQMLICHLCIYFVSYLYSFFKFGSIITLLNFKNSLLITARLLRWQSRRTCTHLLLQEHQNHNQLLNK